LSKDALAGTVPLRTFGQLKQLWEAKVEPGSELPPGTGGETPQSLPKGDHGSAEAAAQEQQKSEAANTASAPPAETGPQGSSS
jgi:protein Tex